MFQSQSSPSAHKAQTNTDYYLCHRRATRCEQQPHGRPEQLAGSKMWLVDALIEEAMGHDCMRSGPSLRLTLTVGGSPLQRIFTVCLPDPSRRVRLMAEPTRCEKKHPFITEISEKPGGCLHVYRPTPPRHHLLSLRVQNSFSPCGADEPYHLVKSMS